MKRSLSIFLCTLCMLFTFSQAAHAEKFSEQTLKKMSVFVSNFTELFMFNFNLEQEMRKDDSNFFINFGMGHTLANYDDKRTIAGAEGELHGYVEGKWVQEAVKKYFNYDLEKLVSSDEYTYDGEKYKYPYADGETRYYAQVTSAKQLSKNIIEMTGYIYHIDHSDEMTKEERTFVALARPHTFQGKETWSIFSLTTMDN